MESEEKLNSMYLLFGVVVISRVLAIAMWFSDPRPLHYLPNYNLI